MKQLVIKAFFAFHTFVVEDSVRSKFESGPNYKTAAHAFVTAKLRLGLRAPLVARNEINTCAVIKIKESIQIKRLYKLDLGTVGKKKIKNYIVGILVIGFNKNEVKETHLYSQGSFCVIVIVCCSRHMKQKI